MNISNGIVWIVFDNHDKLVGCFTKEEFAKAACSGHTGWYYPVSYTHLREKEKIIVMVTM